MHLEKFVKLKKKTFETTNNKRIFQALNQKSNPKQAQMINF